MKFLQKDMGRRKFLNRTGAAVASAILVQPTALAASMEHKPVKKKNVAIVGTGSRGLGMWGKEVVKAYRTR